MSLWLTLDDGSLSESMPTTTIQMENRQRICTIANSPGMTCGYIIVMRLITSIKACYRFFVALFLLLLSLCPLFYVCSTEKHIHTHFHSFQITPCLLWVYGYIYSFFFLRNSTAEYIKTDVLNLRVGSHCKYKHFCDISG